MGTRIGVYPGTFDPITLGHADIIRRGAKLVDKLIIGVTTNPSKNPMFTPAERMVMVEREVPLMGMVGRGVTIRGVNMGDSVPHSFIPMLVDLIVEGKFPLHKLVKFYDFHDINHALEDQEHGKTIKPIIRF